MTGISSSIYAGTVVHKRLAPERHAFTYRVFSLCLDVDEIDRLDAQLRLFSRNRFNLLSLRDSDLGEPGAEPVAAKARRLLVAADLERFGAKIELVCYPRLLGYVFNPLSVYFCRDSRHALGAIIYEVTNTFGERKSYVIPAPGGDGSVHQSCEKQLYVSPFTGASGSYGFHAIAPCERIVIGVNFREGGRPVLKTHFSGERLALTDRSIAALVARHPLMTLKVFGAIHVEAARLWKKGVPLVPRHTSPPYSFTVVRNAAGEVGHA